MDSLGSFFNFFEEDHDALDIGEYLENVFQEAVDVYAQVSVKAFENQRCATVDADFLSSWA